MNHQKKTGAPRQAKRLRKILAGASFADVAAEEGVSHIAVRFAVRRLIRSLRHDVEAGDDGDLQQTTNAEELRASAATWLQRLEIFERQLDA